MKAGWLIAAMLGLAACSVPGGSSSASTASAELGTPSPHAGLDQAVPTPVGLPADVPVYPGARLTAGAAFPSTGETTFGIEWETLDTVDRVHTFYASKLNEGDWTITFSGGTGATFAAVFSKKGSRETGAIGADGSSGLTKISLSLVVPGQ